MKPPALASKVESSRPLPKWWPKQLLHVQIWNLEWWPQEINMMAFDFSQNLWYGKGGKVFDDDSDDEWMMNDDYADEVVSIIHQPTNLLPIFLPQKEGANKEYCWGWVGSQAEW